MPQALDAFDYLIVGAGPAGCLLANRYPVTGALWGDWYAHAIYATVFLYGYLLGTDTGIWAELARLRRASLPLALGCFAFYLLGIETLPDDVG